MRQLWWVSVLFLALAGCGHDRTVAQLKSSQGNSRGTLGRPDPFAKVMLQAKPEKALSVREVLKARDGDTVTVTGRTPSEKVKPFNASVAAFILMDPRDLDKEDIKKEFDCDDAAT